MSSVWCAGYPEARVSSRVVPQECTYQAAGGQFQAWLYQWGVDSPVHLSLLGGWECYEVELL